MASLQLNTGYVCVLRHDEAFFGSYDKIQINAGSALFSTEAYAELSKKGLQVNGGKLDVIDVTGEPLSIGDAVIDGKTDYSGKFLVGGDVLIATADASVLNGVAGFYADTVICPESFVFPKDVKIIAEVYRHNDGAVVLTKPIKLTAAFVDALEGGATVWTNEDVNALDEGAAAGLAQKNARIRCACVTIYEGCDKRYGAVFEADERVIVPDGCDYIDGDFTLDDLAAEMYGDKLFVTGHITVTPDAAGAFERLSYVYAGGGAYVPAGLLKRWKAIGSAGGETLPYKGSLIDNNGAERVSAEQLRSAAESGIAYTFINNGKLTFAEDVTADDFVCVAAIYNCGKIQAPSKAMAALRAKIIKQSGAVEALNSEDSEKPAQDDGKRQLNVGSFVRV